MPEENPFLGRLKRVTSLGSDDLALVGRLCDDRRKVKAHTLLVDEGARPERLHVLIDGWACRSRLLASGRRQIVALLLPGDVCDLDALHFRMSDVALSTLTPCTIATPDRAALRDLVAQGGDLAAAVAWLDAVEKAMLFERVACLGRRSARERLAHLMCELFVRLSFVGRATGDAYLMPITQEEIADTIGLTAVHVNRVMKGLREEGLVERCGHELVVADWGGLRRAADFQSGYLHLEGVGCQSLSRFEESRTAAAWFRSSPALSG